MPPDLLAQVKEHKAGILYRLQRRTELVDLPWPVGYGGLPRAKVEMAETVMNKFGVTDPVKRRYNILASVIVYYQVSGENHGTHYKTIKAERLRLGRILDPNGDP